MLPKKNKLSKKEVENLFKHGLSLYSDNLSLKFTLDQKNTIQPKISFIVPKKISKSSAKRNFLKRRGFSVIEKLLPSLPRGLRVAFLFKNKSLDVFGDKRSKSSESREKLEKEIESILSKL